MSFFKRRPVSEGSPARPVRRTPIRPLQRPPLLVRLWLSCIAQYLFLIALASVVGCTYYVIHKLKNEKYWASISNIVRTSLGTYQLGLDATGHRIELQYAGQPVTDVSRLPPAPFSIEKIASVQGVLSRYVALSRSANHVYLQNESAFISAFAPTDNGGFMLRLAWFPGAGDSPAEFRISASTMALLRTLHGPALQHTASSHLCSSRVFDPTQAIEITTLKSPAEPAAPATDPVKAEETLKDVRAYFHQRIAASVVAADLDRRELSEAYQPGMMRALTPAESQAIADYFSAWDARIIRQIQASCAPAEKPACTATCRPECKSDPVCKAAEKLVTLDDFFAAAARRMCDELIEVVRAETSSFWLMGRWRWLEMIWWVWFGILTQALVQHGLHLVGVLRGEIWQPGELLRTFAKFFYAPLLTLGLFFLAEYIGSTREAVEFSRNSPVTLGICLILGLFPNTAYRIIKEVTTTVFRTTLTTSGSPKAAPATTAVNLDVSHKAAGVVYNKDRLKENIATLVTAPLQIEKK
jgi:hypothetical protein